MFIKKIFLLIFLIIFFLTFLSCPPINESKVATPTFNYATGTYNNIFSLEIFCQTPGATIYFTLNGSNPTTSSIIYYDPIYINISITVEAMAVKEGMQNSDLATVTYTLKTAKPNFDLSEGAYLNQQILTMSSITDWVDIYYTTDNSNPTSSLTKYTSPITVPNSQIIKAIAIKTGFQDSDITQAIYNIWEKTIIDYTVDVGMFNSISKDNNNKIHISYWDLTNSYLKYISKSSGSWANEIIDTNNDSGWYTSIGIDSTDKVYISYYDNQNKDLKNATNSSGSWQIQTLDSTGDVGLFSSLCIDCNGKVHISYYDNTNGNLKYTTNSSGTWQILTLDSAGSIANSSKIVINSQNKIFIFYVDNDNHSLKYITNLYGGWKIFTVISEDYINEYFSAVIDSNDIIHVCYYDNANKDLYYIVIK